MIKYLWARFRDFCHGLRHPLHYGDTAYHDDGKVAFFGCLTCNKVYWASERAQKENNIEDYKA